jgi:predicted TIM-barrel fold metal-dependent hydrolase
MSKKQLPIINCHTHTFTGDHVPPFLAKTYIPFPFYYLIPVRVVIEFFRWWYNGPGKWKYQYWHKRLVHFKMQLAYVLQQLEPLTTMVGYALTLYGIVFLNRVFAYLNKDWRIQWIANIDQWLIDRNLLYQTGETWLDVTLLIILLLSFPAVRNMLLLIGRIFWKFLTKVPGKQTKELFQRYLNIGRYTFHKDQGTIFSKLRAQYPIGTGIIILPMDMEYMGAGQPKVRYREQMEKLAELAAHEKNQDNVFPFVFIDPRRIVPLDKEINTQSGDKIFCDFNVQRGKVELAECFVKDLVEKKNFRGFKIYPALGYFPFDENLLLLWKYAADNNIPIMTHCIRGTIFYRGKKKNEWNEHPVFEQAYSKQPIERDAEDKLSVDDDVRDHLLANAQETNYVPLDLPQMKNVEFQDNFTHPMNYLCLLEEELLRKLIHYGVTKNNNQRLAMAFGYTNELTPLTHNLKHLKICFAHFGGDDEWKRYFEKDRDNYSSQLTKYPEEGIQFFQTVKGQPSRGKPEHIWKYTDWYSIICSIILQHTNVYADISYILHDNPAILPLLKQTLHNEALKEKVLYGTDFFVVRNHKSDKEMLADYLEGLTEEEFEQVAKDNPRAYLSTTIHGPVKI